jgi:O-antigen/teichoic acid export membrane protein
VLRGAGFAGAGYLLTQALTLGFYLALARLATPRDFGQFASASIVISTGLLFTESGMLSALIQRRDRVDEAASTAVVSTALGGLLFATVALAASPVIGAFFHSGRVGTLAAALSGLLFVRSLQVVPEALLQRRFSFARRLIIQPVQVLAFGTAAVMGTSNGLGPWGLVIGYYAAAVTDVALSWALVGWRPRRSQVSLRTWRELIRFGRHVLTAGIILRVGEQVPTAILGRFVGAGALGQYRYADRMASTPFSLILSTASYVIFPAFSRISHDRRRFGAAFLRSLGGFSAVAFPLGLFLIPFGVPAAVILFGSVWRDAGYAAMALGPFVAAAAFMNLSAEALKAEGRPSLLVPITAVTAVASAAAMAALAPLGLVGVAAGVSVGTVLGAGYALNKLRGVLELPLRDLVVGIWPAGVAGSLVAVAFLPVDRLIVDPTAHSTAVGILLLGGESLAAVAVYAALLAMLAPGTFALASTMLTRVRGRLTTSRAVAR